MAIHVDIHPKALSNLKEEAKRHGKTAREHASEALSWLFSGDRSVFQFTPALAPELLPKCEYVFSTTLGNTALLDEVEEYLKKRVAEKKEEFENERIAQLKKEDAVVGETDESNDRSTAKGPVLIQ